MSFFGLNIARSGLFAAQKALNTISHNIANSQTEGYSRQRVEQVESNPLAAPGGRGMIGSGVEAKQVTQIRNEFLDLKLRTESTVQGQWEVRSAALSELEAVINEPADNGIRKTMDDFFASFQELSKDPSSLTTRAVVRERSIALGHTLNHMQSQFEKMIKDTDFSIESTVSEINTYAKDLSKLNEQIYKSEMDGSSANDLRDQRNLTLDKLSKLVNIEVTEISQGNDAGNKKMVVAINGQPLVNHDKVDEITLVSQPHKYKDELGLEFDVRGLQWKSGTMLSPTNLKGTLKGQLDMRDNMSDADGPKGIPYYMQKLDEFTNRMATEINAQHASGYGLSDAGTGNAFFETKFIGNDSTATSPKTFTTNVDPKAGEIHNPSLSNSAELKGSNINTGIDLSTVSGDASVKINVGGVDYTINNATIKGIAKPIDINAIKDAILKADTKGDGTGTKLSTVATVSINGNSISIKSNDIGNGANVKFNISGTTTTGIKDAFGIVDNAQASGSNGPVPGATSIKDYVEKQVAAGKSERQAISEWEKQYKGYTIAKDDVGNWREFGKITAKDIKISSKIDKDLNFIAASKLTENGTAKVGDNSNILAMGKVRYDGKMFDWGTPDDFMKSLVSNLGVDGQEAERMVDNQSTLVEQIDNTRKSVSGVSLDEEMTNMVKFQQAYNASARMITTMDEMIDVIVNRMGKVGL